MKHKYFASSFFITILTLLFIISCTAPVVNYKYPAAVKKIRTTEINGISYDIVTFGNFAQTLSDDGESFLNEPLEWRVICKKDKKAFLVSEKVIMGNVPFYENFTSNRMIDGKVIYPNNYEHSEIRAYLNGLSYTDLKKIENRWENRGFLQQAFTKEEQDIICTTRVDNSVKQMSPDGKTRMNAVFVCNNTNDKIFLLSEKEVNTPEYGFVDDNSRIRGVTDYAIDNIAWHAGTENRGGIWWLRSPYWEYTSRASLVLYKGEVDDKTNRVRDTGTGVVPALWINLE